MQSVYDVYVTENNVPGAYIYAVSAVDPDVGQNAYVTYSILECEIQGMSILTYVSINSENGYLYALRSFDFEQIKEFSFMVHAKDSGAPELTANATVNVIIVDQNDNAPSIIAPLGKNGTAREHLPRSAEPGYLVTRIVATDADDGENARLSYSILRGNELGMFRMDWRTGELRTARRVSSKRDPPHPYDLLIEVRDHGQPPLSSSASINVVLGGQHSGGPERRPGVGQVQRRLAWTSLSSSSSLSAPCPSSSSSQWLCWRCAVRRIRNWTSTRAWPETRAVSAAVAKRVGARRSSVNRTSCSSRALTWPVPHRCRWRNQAASARTTRTRTTATRCAWLRSLPKLT